MSREQCEQILVVLPEGFIDEIHLEADAILMVSCGKLTPGTKLML